MNPRFRIRKIYHYWILEDHEKARVYYTLQRCDAIQEMEAIERAEINELIRDAHASTCRSI